MKLCPICATSYPAGQRTCPTHGTVLVDTPELPPGTVIRDCYRIERVLGKGGMGIVYLAEHTLMGEPRALKFLAGALASNPSFVQRFLQEARAANKLHHLNIAQTYELGQAEDGSFYISMEFVDGPSLRSVLEQSPRGLPPDRAFNIARGVAEALGAAHAKRMVHRDIKPENILLAWTPESEVAKVVDFGIVAMNDSVARLTQTGRPMLTAEYAAPEQWRGLIPASELDGRTDLYSLGCMFYEMLTGSLPFHSDTYEGWFEQHVTVIPLAPSQIRPELARYAGLDSLVLQLLAKDREQRPSNVAAFLAAFDAAIVARPAFDPRQSGGSQPFRASGPPPPPTPKSIQSDSGAAFRSGQVSSLRQPNPGASPSGAAIPPPFRSGERSRTILETPAHGAPYASGPNPSAAHPSGPNVSGPNVSGQHSFGHHSSGSYSSGLGPATVPPPPPPAFGRPQNFQSQPPSFGQPSGGQFAVNFGTQGASRGTLPPPRRPKTSGQKIYLGLLAGLLVIVFCLIAIVLISHYFQTQSEETPNQPQSGSSGTVTYMTELGQIGSRLKRFLEQEGSTLPKQRNDRGADASVTSNFLDLRYGTVHCSGKLSLNCIADQAD